MNDKLSINPFWVFLLSIGLSIILIIKLIKYPFLFSFFLFGYIFVEFLDYIYLKKFKKENVFLSLLLSFSALIILFIFNIIIVKYIFHIKSVSSTNLDIHNYDLFVTYSKSFIIGFVINCSKIFFRHVKKLPSLNLFLLIDFDIVKTKKNDMFLGTLNNKKPFYMSEENFNHHTQIIGGSGSGKTNLIKNIIEDRIKRNKAVVFLDFKAEFLLENWLKNCLIKHGRIDDYMLFSLSKPSESFSYNPIKTGDVSQISSKIMNSLIWSEVFYQKYSQSSLNIVLDYLSNLKVNHNRDFSIHDLNQLFKSKKFFYQLEAEFQSFLTDKEGQTEFENALYSEQAKRNLVGLQSDLENICRCSLGIKLKSSHQGSLLDLIRERKFIYFQMNSMLDSQSSRVIGKLLLKDLIFQVGVEFLGSNPDLNCTLIVDEFAEFATDSFAELINRCRGAKLQIIIAHQSSGDLDKISPHFSNQIETNTANKIIFGTSLHTEAEKFSKYLGTRSSTKTTQTISNSLIFGTQQESKGSIRDVEEFVVHPNEFKNLKRGQAVVIKRNVDIGHGIVSFPLANEY
jgi:hypothetical protein